MIKHLQKLGAVVVAGCALLGSSDALGQVQVQRGNTVTEQFNAIGAEAVVTLPANWKVSKSTSVREVSDFATAASQTERAGGAGLSTTAGNGVYNFSASEGGTDQAIGFLSSGSATKSGNLYAHFTNTGSTVITELDISYTAEKYRKGSRAEGFSIELYYSLNGTDWISAGDRFKVDFSGDVDNTGYDVVPGDRKNVINQRLEINIPANGEFYLAWNYSVTSGTYTSNAQALAIDDVAVTFGPVDSSAPVISAPTTLNIGDGIVGTNITNTYKLSGRNLTSDVTLTATEPFQISKSATSGFGSTLTFAGADFDADQTVYVRATSSAVGALTGTITHTSSQTDDVVLNVTANVVSPYTQNFDNCTSAGSTNMPGGWQQISVAGDVAWGCTTFGRTGNAVQINGYNSSTQRGAVNEDWLISPKLNLADFTIPSLSFWTTSAFQGPALKLMISTDYDGVRAPSTATWTELNANFPEVGSDNWTESKLLLDAYKQANVYVAFVYTSLDQVNGSSRWTVDDFTVEDVQTALVTSPLTFDFGALPANRFSEAAVFTVRALGLENGLTITAPANFQVSKDNITYTSAISYTAEEVAAEQTAYARFFPGSTALSFEGKLTFTSGENFTEERGKLTGSSIPKSTTLDVVSWNVEWFGADKDGDGAILGPTDNELQYNNVKQAILALDADIYALQEIANEGLMEQLISELPGYSFVKSDTYSYSQRPSNFESVPQKLYVVYKTATVALKGEKVLLKQLYNDLLANTKVLPGYPGSSSSTAEAKDDSFWASGRMPYMVMLDATINGITQRLHLINVHARANSGTNMTVYNQRMYDLQVLKDSLDAQYPNVNLIMLGDYNDDVDMAVVGTNNPSTYKVFVDDEDYKVLTYELSQTGVGTYNAESFLDHITVSKSLVDEYIPNSIQIQNGLINLIPRYFTTTSDHLPIAARFDFSATPVVTFTEAFVTKKEGEAAYEVNLTLSEAQAEEHTVVVSLVGGATATMEDFTATPAFVNSSITLTIPANTTAAKFSLSAMNDTNKEADEKASFVISSVSTGLGVGEARIFDFNIQDNTAPTGIADATKGQFSVYPNPVQDYVRLSLPERVAKLQNVSLVVYGIDGRVLFSATGSQQGVQQVLNTEVSSLKKGLYVIKVEAGKEVFVSRMLKK